MRIPKERAPLYEMLERHAGLRVHSFHVPGHKQRVDALTEVGASRFSPILPLDLTELPDTDDLHHPAGPVEEAQQLAAECFGAEETRFLVGGSTAGNLAMILGTVEPGELLIVQRNVHRSIIHGLMMAGARAVLLPMRVETETGLAVMPEPDTIEQAIAKYPEAKGIVLSTPNYYGMNGDLQPVVQLCHQAGIPVLVDEAHGPHFGLHPLLPASALKAGADVVVQSTHKMLGAMTMGAMLHMQGPRVNREAVRQALRMVQSSSPSFPLLASLDLARRRIHTLGQAAFEFSLQAAGRVRDVLPRTRFRHLQGPAQDPLKMALYDKHGALDGFRIRDELAARGCIVEMADRRYAVAAFGIGSRPEDGEALAAALEDITRTITDQEETVQPFRFATDSFGEVVSEPVTFSRTFRQTESIPLEASVGRTAGEWIVPYPPGIPELFPGERITQQVVQRLAAWRKQGANIQGAEDPSLSYIRVWLEQE